MKTRLLRIIFIVSISLVQLVLAQEKKIHIDADYAIFKNPNSADTKIVELSYSLYPLEWTYKSDVAGNKNGQVVVQLELFQDKKMIYRTAWKSVNKIVKKLAGNESKVDIMRFKMKQGTYRVFYKVIDANKTVNQDSTSFYFKVPEDKSEKYDISDILLCNQARKSKQEDSQVFRRGKLYIEPNPSRVYGGTKKVIDFYIELYGLNVLKDKSAIIYYHIDDENGEIQKDKYSKREKIIDLKAKEGINGTLNLTDLFSGTYWLSFQVFDKDEKLLVENKRKFFLYNPGGNKKEKSNLALRRQEQSVGALKLAGDIDEDTEIKTLTYIATKQEKDIIKKLINSNAKINFLKDFWIKRDPDQSTVINEYRKIYLERVLYTNAKFGHLIDGWRTDRGRVYIMYGKSDNIEHHNSTANGRAYQIWKYDNIEGGVEFVFISFSNTGNYTLVSSTKRGEIKNDNWQNMIELSGQNQNIQGNNQY